jgi:hypothetical protein
MNKKILVAILLTISALMVGCGNKDTKVETSNNSVAVSQSKGSDTSDNSSNKTETTNKYGTLQDLKNEGFEEKESQLHDTYLENYKQVVFVAGYKKEDNKLVPKMYLTDNVSNILYKFPEFNGTESGTFKEIMSVSFKDYNNDQLIDLLVTANYQNDKGVFSVNNIFFQKGKEFINNKEYDELINTSLSNGTSNSVIEFVNKNPFKQ